MGSLSANKRHDSVAPLGGSRASAKYQSLALLRRELVWSSQIRYVGYKCNSDSWERLS